MSGQEFIEQFAPFQIPKILSAKWLWGNEAIWNGETLQVSPAVYDCLADGDTTHETFKTLDIKYIPLVRLSGL